MNSRIRRPLYISLKSWLCCCSLPTVAPQQKRRMIANDPLKVVSNTQSTWLSGKLKPAELLLNSRISLSYRVQMTQTISLIGWIFFFIETVIGPGIDKLPYQNKLSQRPIEPKSSAFSLYFTDSTVRELLGKAFLMDKWENTIIPLPAAARPRKVKYDYETQNLKNLEQLNSFNHGINIIKVNVGCSTIIVHCALKAHFLPY